jgi:predicted MFS family arabinose efflux permease
MPLAAVVTLQATATETGILRAVVALPNLLLGLVAGAWIDRLPRRRVLITAELVAAVLLATIPLAAILHRLLLAQLFAVAFLSASAGLFGGLAASAYLPALVGREALVDANSKLAMTFSTLNIVGSGVAGFLVQLLTAPIAIVFDSALSTVAAAVYMTIRRPEPPPPAARRALRLEVAEGIGVVLRSPLLRAQLLAIGSFNLFSALAQAVLVLYMARQLHLQPAGIGLVFAASGPGALVGAFLARRMADRLGVGSAILIGALAFGLGWTIAPLAAGPPVLATLILMAGQFLLYGGSVVANVNVSSLRQAMTPDRLLGRVNGTMLLVFQGVVPFGALAGGVIGQLAGPRFALGVAAAGTLSAMVGVLFSPLARVRTLAEVPQLAET